MANKNLKSIKFPDLPDTYIIPQGTVTEADLEDLKENGTVANARQLIPSAMETERVPYNFRTSGGSLDIGDREFDKLVGLSLPWNQLAKTMSGSATNNGITATMNGDGTVTLNGTATAQASFNIGSADSGHANHVKLIMGCPTGGGINTYRLKDGYGIGADGGNGFIEKTSGTNVIPQIIVASGYTANNLVFKPQIFDLTQMFGSTIADYILALETATAGAGVAWFKKFFPKQYYAYNAGELMSVQASSHDTVGFNAWDEETELGYFDANGTWTSGAWLSSKNPIPVVPNTTYYCNAPNACYVTFWKDAVPAGQSNESLITGSRSDVHGGTFTTPSNCRYIHFNMAGAYGTTYKNDICINLHWDGARDGEYEPYKKNSYALDPIELRGILKLDSNNEPYADGDTYEADGTVTRKYGIVDLGTLTWNRNATNQYYAPLPTAGTQYTGNHICTKYVASARGAYDGNADKAISITGGKVWVRDTAYPSATGTEFKTAMSGVYLVYELATPTTEEADPFTDPQTVDNWGTEQYVDKAYTDGDRDVEIPCGHETKYPVNLRDKVETAPNAPTSDGDYIVHCESGQLTYIALGSTTTIQNIISRLEALEG